MPTKTLPNIVFIMADQMKWSALRMYSEIGIRAPSLERLAARGVTFQHAITPHPLCVPARTSVMTGRYPHSTGCRRNETLMPRHETHAFQIWKDAGYITGLIGKNHCFAEREDLDMFDVRCEISHAGLPEGDSGGMNADTQGMDWVRPIAAINAAHQARRGLNENAQSPRIAYAVTDYPEEDYGSSLITAQSEAFLERVAEGDRFGNCEDGGSKETEPPFALWISYPDPHEPREAPRRYVEMFPTSDLLMPPIRAGEFEEDGGMQNLDSAPYPPSGEVSPAPEVNRVLFQMLGMDDDDSEHIKGLISVHNAMCRMVDDGIGRILDKLEELEMLEDTILVFASDHGDFMGEHNMAVKGGVFYDCLTRVPLIVSYPNGGVPKGVTDVSMVNTLDILPTLLELQGLGRFEGINDGWANDADVPSINDDDEGTLDSDGKLRKSLLRRIQGKPLPTVTGHEPRSAAFSEYGAGGPPVALSHLEELPKPWGYRTLIQTLWGREAQGRRKMVRTKEWKYVHDPMSREARTTLGIDPEDELYDLINDPWELYNIAHDPTNREIVSQMRRLLTQWMIETEDPEPVPLPMTMSRAG